MIRKKHLPASPRLSPAELAPGFAEILKPLLPWGREDGQVLPEPLAELEYPEELRLKQLALERFWDRSGLPGTPGEVVPSPLARRYRSTSKRRAAIVSGRLYLRHAGEQAADRRSSNRPGKAPPPPPGIEPVSPSRLEPETHHRLFCLVQQRLSRREDAPLAESLHWVVLRDGTAGCALLLNVFRVDRDIGRKAKQVCDWTLAQGAGIVSVFLFHDPSRSEYYLEAGREEVAAGPAATWRDNLRCLAGPREIGHPVADFELRFSPLVFSQVNRAMLPELLRQARSLLGLAGTPAPAAHLLDLYCGYGLFSFGLGARCGSACGLELAGPAIESARRNQARLSARNLREYPPMRFLDGRITPGLIARGLAPIAPRPAARQLLAILDPPRQGTEAGVIAALGQVRPERVLHVCCGTDGLPEEVRRWQAAGYGLSQAAVLDLFPGTANLETLLLLLPS